MARRSKLPRVLHIGCGLRKVAGAYGVDVNPESEADLIYDLDKLPYPFADNTFERVIAENIIEHLSDVIGVMEELHRICKNGARINISTSHFSSLDSFTDPTHKHFFTSRTFDYFVPEEELYKYKYSKAKFRKVSVRVGPVTENWLLGPILGLINKYVVWYEKRFAFIFPVGVIDYELEVIKD